MKPARDFLKDYKQHNIVHLAKGICTQLEFGTISQVFQYTEQLIVAQF